MSGKPPIPEEELRKRLSPMAYAVTQEAATEPPFSGEYVDTRTDGTYACVVCGATLFESGAKYDAGCGWPSFFEAAADANLTTHSDFELGYERIEVRCGSCGSHLGHVFPDGPAPTGQRYCINSCALDLDANGSERAD